MMSDLSCRIASLRLAVKHWLSGLDPRERNALKILTGFLAFLFFWDGVYLPIGNVLDRAKQSYQINYTALAWIKAHAEQAKSIKQDELANAGDKPLLAIANDTAQDYKLSFTHAEPDDKGGLHLSLENVSFSRLLLWLNALENKENITLTQVAIEKQEAPSIVNATITFQALKGRI